MAVTDQMTPAGNSPQAGTKKKDKTHWLYISVIAAVVLGAIIGLVAPDLGKALKPLGDGFVALIKMIIAPVIFCTIVLGVGSVAKAATVGKVGGLALLASLHHHAITFALAIGTVVATSSPGSGLQLEPYGRLAPKAKENSTVAFLLDMIRATSRCCRPSCSRSSSDSPCSRWARPASPCSPESSTSRPSSSSS